jgi:hypothetical protein
MSMARVVRRMMDRPDNRKVLDAAMANCTSAERALIEADMATDPPDKVEFLIN